MYDIDGNGTIDEKEMIKIIEVYFSYRSLLEMILGNLRDAGTRGDKVRRRLSAQEGQDDLREDGREQRQRADVEGVRRRLPSGQGAFPDPYERGQEITPSGGFVTLLKRRIIENATPNS